MGRVDPGLGIRAGSNFWAEKGKRIIDEEFSSLSGIGQVCEKLGISESHFRELFRSAFGMNPKDYLQRVQIEYARQLLLTTPIKVSEISDLAGFKHRWAFYRIFKRLTGYNPSEYRRTKKNLQTATKITGEI